MLWFFFNDTATTEIYTLSLHDALPIWNRGPDARTASPGSRPGHRKAAPDRKSTRLNSSHLVISYAVFCLKTKQQKTSPLTFIRSKSSGPYYQTLSSPT